MERPKHTTAHLHSSAIIEPTTQGQAIKRKDKAAMIEQILTAILGIAILGGAYLIDLIVGIAKVSFTPELKWSWAKMGKDLVKAILMAIGIVGFVAVLNALSWYGTLVGANLSVLADVSFPALIAAIVGGSAYYLGNALKNIVAFINSKNVAVTIDESKADYKAIATEVQNVAKDFWKLTQTKKATVEAHKTFEAEGGKGAAYSVPIDSYAAFRNTVLGHAYDIDGYYSAQCWDGAALLWQQLGRSLTTGGTGAAKGTWSVPSARSANAGSEFDLITDFNQLKVGDVIVFGYGQYGHIAFVDSVNPLRIMGQNQNSDGNGSPFNIINATNYGFIGAFRLKRWNPAPAPVPTPAPAPAPTKDISETVAAVRRGDYGNEPERSANLRAAGYDPAVVQAAVNAQVAGEAQAPSPAPASSGISPGDTVIAWGRGTEASDGSGQKTVTYPETAMKVIRIVNGRLALNQYNDGVPENAADVTAWWPVDHVRKA